MTRAMTLIKMYFVGYLRASTADVSRRILEKVSSFCRSWGQLCHAHLRLSGTHPQQPKCISCIPLSEASPPTSPLLGELEGRANTHPERLSALLICHSAYFSARKGLLVSWLVEEIRGLNLERTESVGLVLLSFVHLFLW
jgi:conserved oligomeric Golgi complex subunit 3